MDRAVVADLVIKKERLAAEMEYLVLLPVSVPIMLNHPLSVAIQVELLNIINILSYISYIIFLNSYMLN